MWYKYSTVVVVLAAMVASAGLSCSSGPDEVDDPVVEKTPRADTAEAFDDAAEWLPADTDAVVVSSGASVWEVLGHALLPTTRPDAESGALGTIEGLRADLDDVLRRHFAFDFGQSYSLVVGVDAETSQLSVVLFGDYQRPPDKEAIEIADYDAYEIEAEGLLQELFGPRTTETSLYAMPIDEPRRGLVLSIAPEALEATVGARGDEGMSLDSDGVDNTFARLFDDARGSNFAVAVTTEHVQHMLQELAMAGIPIPSAAIVTFGDDLSATFEGEPADLERIIAIVGDYLERLRGQTEQRYEAREGSYLEQLEAIYLHHAMDAIAGQMEPELGEDTLHYEVQLTDEGSRMAVLLGALAPYGLYTARTAFETYAQRSKAAEAEGILSAMSDGACAYFEGDQQYSTPDGVEPWHEGDPDNRDIRPGMPVGFDDKVFPGGPDIKVTTAPEVPEGSETVEFDPRIEGDVDFDADVVFTVLHLHAEHTQFRYTFETGSGIGEEATATITAEANFDPSTPEYHTVIQEMYVDPMRGCVANPMYTVHEGN